MSAIAGRVAHPAVSSPDRAVRRDGHGVTSRGVDGREWDRIVSGFDDVCQEQLHCFAAARWPGVALEPRLFERHGRIVGGALMMIQHLPLRLASLAIAKWAPMLADAHATDAAGIYDGMIEALIAEYAERRGMLVSILPRASTEAHNARYEALRSRGFQRGAPLPFPDRYLVDVRLDDDAQRKSFGQTWRRQLNKGEKSGLSFEHAKAGEIGAFKTLYAAMTGRKQFADHSAVDTLDCLMALDEPLRPKLFFVRHEGETVAGALVFKAGERAVYLYGATNDKALPLRAGYVLHWHVIRWLRDHTAARWYDLGGTDGHSGLHQFKKGMVGDQGLIRSIPPVVNYAARPMASVLGTAALNAREAINEMRRRIDAARPSGTKPDLPRVPLDAFK
jgi:hypothetical protein